MASLLKGTAFITGAASGIGQHTAYSLASYGITRLAISDLSISSLSTTHNKLKSQFPKLEIFTLATDVNNDESVKTGLAETVKAFGRIDVAVNNAGIGGSGNATLDVERKEWESVIGVNLSGVWACQKAEIGIMIKQEDLGPRIGRGTIINTASMYGLIAPALTIPAAAYAASKHGVLGLTKADATVYAQHGIRINAICPGYIGTPLLKGAAMNGQLSGEISKTPMGRLGLMEEIGDSIVFLASPLASFMCGAGLVVDGGFTCN